MFTLYLQYQIRFLGYKGVVAVDEQLEGIFMRVRKSMNKFKGHGEDFAQIEIAKAFSKPNSSSELFAMTSWTMNLADDSQISIGEYLSMDKVVSDRLSDLWS